MEAWNPSFVNKYAARCSVVYDLLYFLINHLTAAHAGESLMKPSATGSI